MIGQHASACTPTNRGLRAAGELKCHASTYGADGPELSEYQSERGHLLALPEADLSGPQVRNSGCDRVTAPDAPCSAVGWGLTPLGRVASLGQDGRWPTSPRAGSTPQPSLLEEFACAS